MISTAKVKEVMMQLLGTRLTAFVHGLRFALLANDANFADREIVVVRQHLKEGGVAIDVGANGADWTRQLSRLVGRGGAVYAFEADPYYAKATMWACRFLGLHNTKLFPFGLSDTFEDLKLNALGQDGTRASGLGVIDRKARDGKFVYTVKLRPLDSMVQTHPRILDCDVIKCDVEGFELFVLKGSLEIIKKSKPLIIFEIGRFSEQGYCNKDVYEYLLSLNYECFYVDKHSGLVQCDDELSKDVRHTFNRVAVPREPGDSISL
jgi:FkbM family methyltransferase